MKKEHLIQLLNTLRDSFVAALVTLASFLGPALHMVGFVIALILLDTFTGVLAAKKNKVFQSEKVTPVFNKFLLYAAVIFMARGFDLFLLPEINDGFLNHILALFLEPTSIDLVNKIKVTAAFSALIMYREFESIDENWQKIFGWSFFSSFKVIYTKFIDRFKIKKESNED